MSNLTIKANSAPASFDSLSASQCRLRRKNLACDELFLEVAESSPAGAWKYGDLIELFDGATRRFRGKISKIETLESHAKKTIAITAKNPFWDLEQIIYQQQATVYSAGSPTQKMRSKVVLGMDASGNKLTAQAQAAAIAAYAASKGADLSVGAIELGCDMLADEASDITCAEALKKVLRWSPACCAYFDYDCAGAPTLNIAKRASLPSASINADAGNIAEYAAAKRDDLAVESVLVKYERENIAGENAILEIEEDAYPPNANFGGKKSIVMSVELGGYKANIQTHEIETQTIQMASKQWWKNRVKLLAEADDFEIVSTSRTGTLSKELVEGTIVSGMNCQSARDTITGTFAIENADGSELTKTISIKMATTNASTGAYPVWTATRTSEPAPQGLAQAIFEAASALQFDGRVEIIGAKAEDFFAKNISITRNGATAASNMPAYFAEENLRDGTLKIKFGPPKHLYPDDIAELFRINRSRKVWNGAFNPNTGVISASTAVIGGKSASAENDGGAETYTRLVMLNPARTNTIDINARDLAAGETAKFAEVYVCKDGWLATAKIISTTPHIVS